MGDTTDFMDYFAGNIGILTLDTTKGKLPMVLCADWTFYVRLRLGQPLDEELEPGGGTLHN